MRALWWAAVVALLLFAGCAKRDAGNGGGAQNGPTPNGSSNAGQAAAAGEQPAAENNGEVTTEFAFGADTVTYHGELPPGWPGQVQLYPDGTLGETTVSDTPQGKVFSAIMMTTAPPDKVADYYRREFEAEDTHISEITRSPTIANETYYCRDYLIVVMAEKVDDGTKVTFAIQPPAGPDQVLPTIRQYVDLDKLPDDFPEDLIPRYPGGKVINGFADGLNLYSAEMLTTDDLPTAAEYYRKHFTELGWEEQSQLEKDIVRTYTYMKNGERLTLNVSAGGDGENHITISYKTRD
jgi:hypothetical protein